jgi:hypothetical protein
MDNAKTVTADYMTQYYISFSQSGVGSDFTGHVMNVGGTDYGRSGCSNWYDDGTGVTFSFYSPLSPSGGEQYVWTGTTGLATLQGGTLTVTGSGSVTGNYKTQYLVTFTQTGSPVAPTVTFAANIDPLVPCSLWVKAGTSITYTYQAIVSGGPGVQYVLTSVNPASPQTVNAPLTIVGNYETQYYLTVETYGDGLQDMPGAVTPLSGWFNAGSHVTLTAVSPWGSYVFHYWSLDTTFYLPNPITITMNSPHTAVAWYNDPPNMCFDGGSTVDLQDLVLIAHCFGAKQGDPNYNSMYDLNHNGVIDLQDLATVARAITP